jgi:hypothetical protein
MDESSPATVTDELSAVVARTQAAADTLLLHVQLATAVSYGPTAVIDAAMSDIATSADALALVDEERREVLADAATRLGRDASIERFGGLIGLLPDHLAVVGPAERLRETIESIEHASGALALELARRRADIDEVLRQAAGSPGIYDATGRTAPGAGRRPRGAG